jgi:hypothetical protein
MNLQIKTVAEDASLGHLYKTTYQQLSMAHAHPNLPALNSIIENDENEEPVGLRWGPERGEAGELVYALCLSFVVYNLILHEWMKHQPDLTRQRHLEELRQRYARYYNASPDTEGEIEIGPEE